MKFCKGHEKHINICLCCEAVTLTAIRDKLNLRIKQIDKQLAKQAKKEIKK